MGAHVGPRRAKSALAMSTIAETRLENEKMSDDLMMKINALQMKQFRTRVDRDYEIKQATEEAQTVFNQAKMVQGKSKESTLATGWRVIEPPKNLNIKHKHLKERPVSAVFDPDDPRSYSNLQGLGEIRPRTAKKKRAQTPRRRLRPNTAATNATPPEPVVESEPQDRDSDDAIAATAAANRPEPKPSADTENEPLRYSSFFGFIRPMTAGPMRGGFGDPNAGDKPEKGKNTPHAQAGNRPLTAAEPRRPRTAASRRTVSRSQSRADDSGGQSYKDLKSRAHIDYAFQAASESRKADFMRQRQLQQATEAARLQERLKAFYNSLDDFKIKAVKMKHNQMF